LTIEAKNVHNNEHGDIIDEPHHVIAPVSLVLTGFHNASCSLPSTHSNIFDEKVRVSNDTDKKRTTSSSSSSTSSNNHKARKERKTNPNSNHDSDDSDDIDDDDDEEEDEEAEADNDHQQEDTAATAAASRNDNKKSSEKNDNDSTEMVYQLGKIMFDMVSMRSKPSPPSSISPQHTKSNDGLSCDEMISSLLSSTAIPKVLVCLIVLLLRQHVTATPLPPLIEASTTTVGTANDGPPTGVHNDGSDIDGKRSNIQSSLGSVKSVAMSSTFAYGGHIEGLHLDNDTDDDEDDVDDDVNHTKIEEKKKSRPLLSTSMKCNVMVMRTLLGLSKDRPRYRHRPLSLNSIAGLLSHVTSTNWFCYECAHTHPH
jgi:hypothetical protein